MSKPLIVLGDKTSHGGAVLKGSAQQTIQGKAVACVGDPVSCPIHGPGTIVEGHPTLKINGVSVAVDGCKTSCGAALVGSSTVTVG